jgi:hypothetical protein
MLAVQRRGEREEENLRIAAAIINAVVGEWLREGVINCVDCIKGIWN